MRPLSGNFGFMNILMNTKTLSEIRQRKIVIASSIRAPCAILKLIRTVVDWLAGLFN